MLAHSRECWRHIFRLLEWVLFACSREVYRDTTQSEILVSRYKQRFIDKQWPAGCKLPEVYYDPRSVSDDEKVRSSLHAKCVVIDEKDVFVSSANFTKAGQERNIEVGLKIESPALAKRLINHFNQLAAHKLAVRAF